MTVKIGKNLVFDIWAQLVALSTSKNIKLPEGRAVWVEPSLDHKKAWCIKMVSEKGRNEKLLDYKKKLNDMLMNWVDQKNYNDIKTLHYIDESLKIIEELLNANDN